MTPPQPPRKPQTILGAITQVVQTIANVNFKQLALKPNAKVPELWVQDAGAPDAEKFPLLGDRYLLGRSSKSCDIVIRNPVVSQVHLSLSRDSVRRSPFVLRDEDSTNGIYRGKRRIKSISLRHGDIFTLGPPELAAAVTIQYVNPPAWYVKAVRYGFYGFTGLSAIAATLVGIEWTKFNVRPMPRTVTGPVIVYARDGQTPLRPPNNNAHLELKRLREFSPYLPKAVIASEDSRYNWHLGVDPLGILRAVLTNVRGGGIREGASTITQQLARSLFRDYVGTQDSAGRKLREAVVALKMETFYSKDELLQTYLNRVFLGIDLYGFEDAARFYFGKSAKDLSLSEAATLVGILPAPNSFNPIQNYQLAVEYRDRVLERMRAMGMISQDEADRARRSRIEINPKAREFLQSTIAPYFYSYVFSELEFLLGEQLAREGNFIVETGLNPTIQKAAENSLRNTVNNSGSAAGFSQGAVVTLNSSTGEILALAGGVDYLQSQFNRATQALRQPGSTFKIFTYTSAIEQGISPSKVYSCAPLNWGGQTFDGCERSGGSADIYRGLAQSENVIALRVAQDVGLDNVVQMARRFGIKSKLNSVPGLVLGQSEVTVLEMTGAFGVLANRGVGNRPHAIKRIIDSSDCKDRDNVDSCRVIYEYQNDPARNQEVVSAQVADTMTELLQNVVREGTGRNAFLGLGEAGKTGTTNDNVDLWFIGYIPSQELVTGVWLGNDDNTPTGGGSANAAQLWGDYMEKVVR
ncbi:transglycosylase domain-containing protein [Kamptonema sp. UHCC 0994]|uniref:transglycosylase domain-containing protein n=1 Tax=Kamptonema sp. UHCC 0994 TaxID=3031329 RepID=UPI0023B88807|nr:transglycosylase domain-containing protein [Kamptonema sp. UHCC 0994]MDF0551948.1 transglycosylase domain-containing protein [Kamptonema sp. UHCC 0994]